jgi:hypothetical protein
MGYHFVLVDDPRLPVPDYRSINSSDWHILDMPPGIGDGHLAGVPAGIADRKGVHETRWIEFTEKTKLAASQFLGHGKTCLAQFFFGFARQRLLKYIVDCL